MTALIIVFIIPMLITVYLAAQNLNYHDEDKFKLTPLWSKKQYRYKKNLRNILPITFIAVGVLLVICCGLLKMPLPFGKRNTLVYLSFFQSVGWAIGINIAGYLMNLASDNWFSRYDKFR